MGNTPQFSSEWRDYVYETSNRYQNIRYWEIINEIDIIRRYVPNFNSRDYLTFLKEGYTAVKRANPEAKVLFSGLSSITEGDINIRFNRRNRRCSYRWNRSLRHCWRYRRSSYKCSLISF